MPPDKPGLPAWIVGGSRAFHSRGICQLSGPAKRSDRLRRLAGRQPAACLSRRRGVCASPADSPEHAQAGEASRISEAHTCHDDPKPGLSGWPRLAS